MLERLFVRRDEPAAPEQRMQITPWGIWGDTAQSAAGINVNGSSATQLLAVYGCVQLIAGTISTLPRHIYRGGEELTTVPKWFDKPNAYTTMTEFISQTLMSLLLHGNAYWVYGVDGNGAPNELLVVDPTKVTVRLAPGPVAGDVTYDIDGKPFRGRLLHLKGIVRPGDVIGMSPIEAAKQAIGVGLAAQEFAARFYSNGATLSTVIKTQADLTLDQARDTIRKFSGDHAGVRNAHRPGLLDNGADIVTLGVPPEQAQFLESRQFQAAEICSQMFLVDPAWFGMSLGSGSNVCADTATEILTDDGWKRYDEVAVGDTCLTLNTTTGLAEWQPVQLVWISEVAQHEMVRLRSKSHSSLTTPDHRWPVYREGQTAIEWRQSRTMASSDRVLAAAPVANLPTDAKWSDAFVELVAWFYTEGYIGQSNEIRLAQSESVNPQNVARIRAALTEVIGPMNVGRCQRGLPGWKEDVGEHCSHFRLTQSASRPLLDVAPDKVPTMAFLRSLTRAQLELFVQTSLDADGSLTNKGTWVLCQKDRHRLEAFQIACLLTGRSGTIVQNAAGMWSMAVQATARRKPKGHARYVSDVVIEGRVWCPKTPNSTWFARRDGTTYFTGNTYSNLEQQGVRLATFTLVRWLVTLETAFYELLPRPQEMKFNVDGLKRGDLAARTNYYKTATNGKAWLTVDEVREFEDLGSTPEELAAPPQAPPAPPIPLQAVPAEAMTGGTP
jgi:HK97 family phage portal protein